MSWDYLQAKHQLEVQQNINETLRQQMLDAWDIIRVQRRELNRLRLEMARVQGRAMMDGGRERVVQGQ
jgi:hypothetical protein